MKILLFTPFAPTQGGGSQNLRGALPHLKDIEVTWAYLAPRAVDYPQSVHMGSPMLAGGLLASWKEFLLMCLGRHPGIHALAQRLLQLQKALGAQRVWTVAHYEALAVAQACLQAGSSLHLSIHDDPPHALVGRSRRYFLFRALCQAQFAWVLRGAQSVDVTSHPMGRRYLQQYQVPSVAYFPYIHQLPAVPATPAPEQSSVLRAGFLGTLYTPHETRLFAQALALSARRRGRAAEWHFWGLGARQQSWVKNLAVPAVVHGFLPEDALIKELAPMHLLYVNYPFDARSRVFSQTSHCAKLSTYLKAQRPLFAHTPLPSSIADFVQDTNTGLVCAETDPKRISRAIDLLLATPIPPHLYARARHSWYGEENLERLHQALLTPNPHHDFTKILP